MKYAKFLLDLSIASLIAGGIIFSLMTYVGYFN